MGALFWSDTISLEISRNRNKIKEKYLTLTQTTESQQAYQLYQAITRVKNKVLMKGKSFLLWVLMDDWCKLMKVTAVQ